VSIITATEHFIFQTEITDPLKYSAARRQAVAVAWTVSTPALTSAFPPAKAQIIASYGGRTLSAWLTVRSPVEASVGILENLTLNPSKVIAGGQSIGTVTLQSPVATPTIVGLAALESGGGPGLPHGPSSSLVSVPPSVTIPANETSRTFPIYTSASVFPGTTRTATIFAGAVVNKTAALTLEAG